MFFCDNFTFLVVSYLVCHITRRCDGFHYFTLGNGNNGKYSRTPVQIMDVRSKVDCCRKCESIRRCTSVNYMKSSKKCEILTTIPIQPSQLTQQQHSMYLEKACQQRSDITGVSSANKSDYFSVFVYIYNGRHQLKFTFDPSSFRISDINLSDGITKITTNTVKNVRSVLNIQTGNGDEIILYIDGANMVFRYVNGVSSTDDWPSHVSNVFGVSQISALLPTLSQTGVYVFTYDTVSEFSTSDWETFTCTSSYNVDDVNASNMWINAPKGVLGAAWLYPSSGSQRYAFLTTTRNYVIHDIVNHVAVDRGQICVG